MTYNMWSFPFPLPPLVLYWLEKSIYSCSIALVLTKENSPLRMKTRKSSPFPLPLRKFTPEDEDKEVIKLIVDAKVKTAVSQVMRGKSDEKGYSYLK